MKVILAGYAKTGTKTMASAFQILNLKTYDWMENFWYLGDDWTKIMTKGGTVDDFKRMYKDVDAVTDAPCFWFWEQIHEAFPDSKIILTVREEDSWYESLVRQFNSLNSVAHLQMLSNVCPSGWRLSSYTNLFFFHFGAVRTWYCRKPKIHNAMIMKRMYREHNNYVMTKAPSDKLLIYDVRDGWEPLCKFLDIPVPKEPFPHQNAKASVVEDYRASNAITLRIKKEIQATYLLFLAISVLVIGGCVLCSTSMM